jgi:hypothetical protein
VKNVSGTPDNGQVVETTTRRRIIAAKTGPQPNLWEYLAALTDADWSNHILYLYRDDPPPTIPLLKCSTPQLEGTTATWNDQEEMEATLMQKFGGGQFRVMLKRGSERVCVHRMTFPGQYKNLTPRVVEPAPQYSSGPSVQSMNSYYDGTARVAETAIHTMANQEKQAVEIGISALAQAANVIKNFTAQPTGQDDLTKQIMAVLIQRALAPPPDPMEAVTKVLALIQQMNVASNPTGSANPVVQRILDSAIDKFLNPPASGPAVSAGAELIRTLPSIAQYITQGMADYARIMEAQKEVIAMQRSGGPMVQPSTQLPPARLPAPPSPPPPAPAIIQPPPTAAARAGDANMFSDPMLFIESKIVEILNEPQSPEWAAEEAIAFLDRLDPNIVTQLTGQGEPGLTALFHSRPALEPATKDLPRLQAFVRAFLKLASQNGEETAAETKKPN